MTKQMKIARGTARKERRASIESFRLARERALAAIPASTHWCNFAPNQGRLRELSPHMHDVAVVVDVGNGMSEVTTYESTSSYPANVACPTGRARIYEYGPMPTGRALGIAARINKASI